MTAPSMGVWPGSPALGATYDGAGTNFGVFSELAEQVELCLFDDGRGNPGRPDRGGRLHLARLPAPGRPGPAVRLPRARAVGSRVRLPLRSPPAAPRPVRPAEHRTRWTRTRRLRRPVRDGHRPLRAPLGGGVAVLRLGLRPAAAAPVAGIGPVRGARQGPDPAASRRSRPSCAAPTRRSPIPAMLEHYQRLGVTALVLLPVQHFLDRPLARRGWPVRVLGLRDHRVFRARGTVRQRARRPGARVQELPSSPCTRPGSRSSSTSTSRPPPSSSRPAPPRSASAASTPRRTTSGTGLNVRHPCGAAADHGRAAVLGDRDARRRLPVRLDDGPSRAVPMASTASPRCSPSCARTRC